MPSWRIIARGRSEYATIALLRQSYYFRGGMRIDAAALRAWREGMGLAQSAAARALDVPLRTYSRWETGEGKIARPRMVWLACLALEEELAPLMEDEEPDASEGE